MLFDAAKQCNEISQVLFNATVTCNKARTARGYDHEKSRQKLPCAAFLSYRKRSTRYRKFSSLLQPRVNVEATPCLNHWVFWCPKDMYIFTAWVTSKTRRISQILKDHPTVDQRHVLLAKGNSDLIREIHHVR